MNKLPLILALLLFGCTANEQIDQENDRIQSKTLENTQDSIQLNETESLSEILQLDPNDVLEELRNGEREFDFYAAFTEPFWTIYFIDEDVVFDHAWEAPEFYKLNREFDPAKDKQSLTFSNGEKQWEILIEKGEGSDGMSEISYPYSVKLNNELYGGGGKELCRETQKVEMAVDQLAYLNEGTYTFHDSHRTSLLKIKAVRKHEFDFYMETGTEEGCTGRIEGVGELYDDGSARFTTEDCKAIYFQFVANGISVKEVDCDDFHGARCSFGGFYD